ncbi:uncharacterized protein LOC124368891 [Homalodisca vitripennis]|uniref:uncharacterized protein LOC124368891 n=1 Tax=Homalodisca vitripennis TaxID=197043 RepID=UPI001EEBCC8B|nr:uncharacterized protein LOC124368891 [Homalodisca vitripennis]
MFKKLICFCLVVAIVRSDPTEEDPSPIETLPTISWSVNPALEQLYKNEANLKNKGISLRSSGSLFGLGIGANLLGVHAGAGIGHGRGGYGDMGQGFVGKPPGSQYPQYPQNPFPQIPISQYPYPTYMQPQPYYLPAAHAQY